IVSRVFCDKVKFITCLYGIQDKVFIAIRGCRTKQLVRSLFSMKKYSRASKSPAVGVKYKYAKTYIFT
ncbi:hypothetical protein, partial [Dorea amylophila]|uniref:hypothetical protein n=1 Tax=Dorea amylophila TaxID=2981789 RepID=UPI0022DFDDC5